MRSIDARHRNFIGMAARLLEGRQTSGCTPSYQRTGFMRSLAIPMLALCQAAWGRLEFLRRSLLLSGEERTHARPCPVPRICALLPVRRLRAPLQSLVRPARGGVAGRRVTPMPFLCPARASAVDFLCPSGPLWPRHEIANSYPVALGRYRPGAFRCWRLSDARRGADRDRRAARDSPRSGHRRHRDLAIVRDRLSDPAPPLPERKQPCSMSS